MEDMNCKRPEMSLTDRTASILRTAVTAAVDYVAVTGSLWSAYWLRLYAIPIETGTFYIPPIYLWVIAPALFLMLLCLTGTYKINSSWIRRGMRLFVTTTYGVVLVTFFMFFGNVAGAVSRLFVAMSWILMFFFLLTGRLITARVAKSLDIFRIPAVLIGAGATARLVMPSMTGRIGSRYRLLGYLDDCIEDCTFKLSGEVLRLGGFSDIETVVGDLKPHTVFLMTPGLSKERFADIVESVQPYVKEISFVPDPIGMPIGALAIEHLPDEQVMVVTLGNNLARAHNRALKRVFDCVLSLLGLPLLAIVGLGISVAIYLDSPGPVIFSHRRVGQGGRSFPCYKFRTMVPNAADVLERHLARYPEAREEWNRDFKLKDDPRVTKVGAFLRKTSLDELPQILNVIKGEMSLVGPRPIIEAEVEKYGPYIRDFYLVPPGITGAWQVGGRSDTTYEERVKMDSDYVRGWSIETDVGILIKTVGVVLGRKGAY